MRMRAATTAVTMPVNRRMRCVGFIVTPTEYNDRGAIMSHNSVDARPASRKYARRRDGGKGGWIARAEEFISPRYHLTDAQHRARVASWG